MKWDLMGPTGPKGPHEPTGAHKPQGPTALRDLKNQQDFWDLMGLLHLRDLDWLGLWHGSGLSTLIAIWHG